MHPCMAAEKKRGRGRPNPDLLRRDRFIEEYLRLGSPAAAAVAAGYKNPSYGARMMKEERVREAIREASNYVRLSQRRTAEEVLTDIIEIGREARRRRNFSMALRALELEGRYYGMWADVSQSNEVHVLNIYRERVLKKAEGKDKTIPADGLVIKRQVRRGVIDVSPVATSPAPKAPAQA